MIPSMRVAISVMMMLGTLCVWKREVERCVSGDNEGEYGWANAGSNAFLCQMMWKEHNACLRPYNTSRCFVIRNRAADFRKWSIPCGEFGDPNTNAR